uniref:Uncharacterized protein n=1 Tax=Arundo donax TaxID=35708 RepID=A0A0A9AFE0_ARUDO
MLKESTLENMPSQTRLIKINDEGTKYTDIGTCDPAFIK